MIPAADSILASPVDPVVTETVVTDSDLLREHLAGDATAFELLHQRHRVLVWRTCQRLVPAAEVEEVVQAVFLVLLRQAVRVQHHPCLPAWLVTTAELTCRTAERDRRRRQRRHEPLPLAELTAAPGATTGGAQPDDVFREVTAALTVLNSRQQAIVVRHLMHGEPQATLAHEFGVAVGTIASDLSRALARMRRVLARRGIAVSALGLGLACRAEASVPVPPLTTTSPSPQALALANQVATIMQRRRLCRYVLSAFILLGLLASGGVAVELARDHAPDVTPPAITAGLPSTTIVALHLPDLTRSRERFAHSPYASQGWAWPASAQQVRQVVEQTQRVACGVSFVDGWQGYILQVDAGDEKAAASSWDELVRPLITGPNPTGVCFSKPQPLRWERWQPYRQAAAANAAAAFNKPWQLRENHQQPLHADDATAAARVAPRKSFVSFNIGRTVPPLAQAAAPGLTGPLEPESDLELIFRLDHPWLLRISEEGGAPVADDDDHDRPGQPRFAAINWQFIQSGVRETFRRIPGAVEATRLAANPGATIDGTIFAPLGGDTLAAIAVADPGSTLINPWLSGSRVWCDERLTRWGLPVLSDLIAQLNGTAVLSVRTATPFPVLDLDLTCNREFGDAVLSALTRQGATADATANGERTLVVGPLAIRAAWVDGHLRATSDPQGFRAPPADAGAFLRDPEIIAARARSGDTSARILGLSRSGAFWSTAAHLLTGMGLPLARELPQRLATHAGGGYLRYETTPVAIAYTAEGLAGGPYGLLAVIGLIESNGQALDPAILLHSLAAAIAPRGP